MQNWSQFYQYNPSPIIIIDESLSVIYFNQAFRDYLSFNQLGKPEMVGDFLTPLALKGLRQNLKKTDTEKLNEFKLHFGTSENACVDMLVRVQGVEDGLFILFVLNEESYVQKVAERLQEGLFEFDLRTNYVWTSNRFREILGYSALDDFEYGVEAWMNRVHMEDRQTAEDKFLEHIQKEVPYEVTYRIQHKQGYFIWVQIKGESVRDEDGNAILLSGTMQDISDQQAMLDKNKKLLEIIEHTSDFIGYCNLEGISLFMNPSFYRILGYEKMPVNIPIKNLHTYNANKIIQKIGLPEAASKGYWQGETELLTLSGKIIYVDQTIVAHKDVDGKPIFFSTILRDNSHKKELRRLQEQAHSQLNKILAANAIGVFFGNIQGVVEEANDFFLNFLNYEKSDLPIRWDQDLTPDEWKEKDEEKLNEVAQKGYASAWAKEYYSKGKLRRVPVLVNVIMLDQKNFIAFVNDLTEQRKIEKDLVDKVEEMENFTQVLAHDFSAPFARVLQLMEIIEDPTTSADVNSEMLTLARQQLESILSNIRNLASCLKMNSGDAGKTWFDWGEVMAEAKENLMVAIEGKGAMISCSGSGRFYGNRLKFVLLLQNLMGNALKYCEKTPEISLSIQQKGNFVDLRVKDNGIGIDKNNTHKIFQAFGRVGDTNAYEGLGLGLYSVKRVVEWHGGEIKVFSELGNGTEFVITLPTIK